MGDKIALFAVFLKSLCKDAHMLKDWPTDEKPHEKLLQHGAHSLSDAEFKVKKLMVRFFNRLQLIDLA
jgi:DNA repair protein RadC